MGMFLCILFIIVGLFSMAHRADKIRQQEIKREWFDR